MLIRCKLCERGTEQKDYRNGYWRRFITLKYVRLEIRMPRIRGMRYESGRDDTALWNIFLYGASTRMTGKDKAHEMFQS
ncbi:MAG: hypothetical protein C4581_07220 [Nitrospiraceae bacterium]|nr:MAG: hypothetical protein C4581_07220 [Nitrospiraceae bacterium]